jgi:hypothetical protein
MAKTGKRKVVNKSKKVKRSQKIKRINRKSRKNIKKGGVGCLAKYQEILEKDGPIMSAHVLSQCVKETNEAAIKEKENAKTEQAIKDAEAKEKKAYDEREKAIELLFKELLKMYADRIKVVNTNYTDGIPDITEEALEADINLDVVEPDTKTFHNFNRWIFLNDDEKIKSQIDLLKQHEHFKTPLKTLKTIYPEIFSV